ncbi:uncharacterized protein K460DRAFT_337270 [Cucurbitaria berberidis CBS 394.84]|uniref:Uncharacterized protein n=1 Tax=Cucurbitaria berberidis CBS 394.84 TaxID=1168544 RepID=A0A9P4GHJ6_9PLEO|nr:uncharacterized protein K460DRAFT_337270 [Cucurbitaria berberidis CBS 394.84]KAF1845275.1 hypothetical protein K460DRAFT_337270 [Cucurbitaria berberidis CBS 394.84]
MPDPRSHNSYLLDRSNGPEILSSTSTPPYRSPDPAALTLAGEMSKPPEQVHAEDPFAYYKAFIDTSISPTNTPHVFAHDDDGYTCHTRFIGAHAGQARAVPYNLAVRQANRSNGAPLATIIEQGSYSTLNSHGSLLSVGRFPSLGVAKNTSPSRVTHRASRILDEDTVQGIQEEILHQQDLCVVITPDEEFQASRASSCPVNHTATPTRSATPQLSQHSDEQSDNTDYDADSRNFKGFFRGFWQNVQAGSRIWTRSLSTTPTPFVDFREGQPEASESSSKSQLQSSETLRMIRSNFEVPHPIRTSSLSATCTRGPESQSKNRNVPTANFEHSARAYPPLLGIPSTGTESETDFESALHLLPPSVATRSRERSYSVGPVQPPRDVARDDGTTGAPTLSNENSHDTSAQNTFDGVSVLYNNIHTLMEVDHARESSRNASFCSTMSTSYSGTVLGVDLDLYHEFNPPARRSRSPTPVALAPVWFTPQMAELGRQASNSESPTSNQAFAIEPPYRSITSSALGSLLPIAVASGIARPNHDTPKISFTSPSGNLIQPEGGLTPMMSTSDFGDLPTMATSYYNANTLFTHSELSARVTTRPSLIPMTKPPAYSAPLPTHLRYHHNYPHRQRPRIESREFSIVHSPAVKGCDGVVRENTFTPQRRVDRFQKKHHRLSIQSTVGDMKIEAKMYKAHLITSASTFCLPARRRKNAPKLYSNNDPSATTYTHTRKKQKRTAEAKQTEDSTRTTQSSQNKQDTGLLAPLAGHALRICFCQPYDGAGKQTHAITADTLCLSNPNNTYIMEAGLPAIRVIGGGNDHKEMNGRNKKDDDIHASKHRRTRSDSAVTWD